MKFKCINEARAYDKRSMIQGYDELRKASKTDRRVSKALDEYFDILADIAVKTGNDVYFMEEIPFKVIERITFKNNEKEPYRMSLKNTADMCGRISDLADSRDYDLGKEYTDYDIPVSLESQILEQIQYFTRCLKDILADI